MAEKPHVNLVFIGHVDHGKSTSVGRLLFDTENVDEQTMRKLNEKAQELGKKGFEFAMVNPHMPGGGNPRHEQIDHAVGGAICVGRPFN